MQLITNEIFRFVIFSSHFFFAVAVKVCTAYRTSTHTLRLHVTTIGFHVTSAWIYINCSRCDRITGGDGGGSTRTHYPLCTRIAVASILFGIDLCAWTLLLSFVGKYVTPFIRNHIRFERFFPSFWFPWPIDAPRWSRFFSSLSIHSERIRKL